MDFTNPEYLRLMLIENDLMPEKQGRHDWIQLCDEVVDANPDGHAYKDFIDRYVAILNSGGTDVADRMMGALRADQMDNYILASLACQFLKIPKHVPLVAWAMENKRLYEGWHGEISNLRTLLCMGFDPDAADEDDDGNTALHKALNMTWRPGIHIRALRALIDGGASVNMTNMSGDSPFLYAHGMHPFTKTVQEAIEIMYEAGGNLNYVADDGMNVLDVVKDTQEKYPDPARLALIERYELDLATNDAPSDPKPPL